MKLSDKVINSMKAVENYDLSFEVKMAEVKRLQVAYQKALELENKEALEWCNTTQNDVVTVEAHPEVTKKLTKLQTYINEVQKHLDNGMHVSEAIENVRVNCMLPMYIKTQRSYISQIKNHLKNS